MKDELIKEVAKRANLPVPLTKIVLKEFSKGLYQTIKETEYSRIYIKNLGSWVVTEGNVNAHLRYYAIPALKNYQKLNDEEGIKKMKGVIRKLWQQKQDRLRYLKKRNSKYYGKKD